MKNPRSRAREEILKILYQIEILKKQPAPSDAEKYMKETSLHKEAMKYGLQLLNGFLENRKTIDETIGNLLKKQTLNQLAVIDRTILRIGVFELLYQSNVPPKVTINEAIELAKKYSTDKSGGFVNGLLDAVKKDVSQKSYNSKGD